VQLKELAGFKKEGSDFFICKLFFKVVDDFVVA
jgi:hypothetical protein